MKQGSEVSSWLFNILFDREVRQTNCKTVENEVKLVDEKGMEWEKELIKVILNDTGRPENVNVYLMAMSSFGFISGKTIKGDASYLALGFFIVFIYVQIMLGKFNMIEHK